MRPPLGKRRNGHGEAENASPQTDYIYDGILDVIHIGWLRSSLEEDYQPFMLRDNGQLSTAKGRLWLNMVGAEVVVNADVYSYRICERPKPRSPAFYSTVQAPTMAQYDAWRKAFEIVLRGTKVSDQYSIEVQRPISVGAHAMLFSGVRRSPACAVVMKVVPRRFPNEFRSFSITAICRAVRDGVVKNEYLAEVLDVYHSQNETHVVMPRYGPALHRRLTPGERWEESKGRELFRQLASALFALHSKGFIHGGVVPSNVLIEKENMLHVRLSGCCLSTVPDPTEEGRKVPVGRSLEEIRSGLIHDAIQYLAPEVAKSEEELISLNEATDFWALGVLMYRILTGEEPFLAKRLETEGEEESPLEIMSKYTQVYREVELLIPNEFKKDLSKDSISLIALLCSPTEARRHGEAVRQHPWCHDMPSGTEDDRHRVEE